MQDPLAVFILSTAKTLRDGRSRRLHRRRIEAIVGRIAEKLEARYGDDAAARCMQRMAACVGHAPGVRRYIWSRVWLKLRPGATMQPSASPVSSDAQPSAPS
jgi:hypothetical protein